jgi:hypothetical protein
MADDTSLKTSNHTSASDNGGGPNGSSMPLAAHKSLESWIWDAACSIRGAKDAAKFKEFILPLIFAKRLCDVFDDG